jgi:hypothetical protein
MPIARITGSATAKVEWLTEQLRARGYDVQALASGDPVAGPADLEIELATCPPEEALAQADAFARTNPQVQILVAPGVLPEVASIPESGSYARRNHWWQRRFLRTPVPARLSEAQPIPERAEFAPQVPPPGVPSNSGNSEATGTADSISLPGSPATSNPRHEFAAMVVDDRSRWQSVLRRQEESRQAELAQLAREEQQREEQRQAREAEIARRNREAELEVLRMASEAEQSTVAGAISLPEPSPSLPGTNPALNEAISSPVPSGTSTLAVEPAGAPKQIPSSAQDDKPLPEILPPQAVETPPVAIPSEPVDTAKPATPEAQLSPRQPVASDSPLTKGPVRAPKFAPPDIGVMEASIEVPVALPASNRPPARNPREVRRAPVPRSVQIPRRRQRQSKTLSRRAREWRIAVVAAALSTIALMGAWSLATNPRPAAPLSLRQLQQSNSIQQELPFGPVRITNQPKATTAPPPARVSAPLTTRVQLQSPASAKSHSAGSVQSQPKPKPSAYRNRRTAAPSPGTQSATDDEVVVRHILPAPHRQQSGPAQAKAGLRHISDLD